jgi:Mg-chelatase subunit ChlD
MENGEMIRVTASNKTRTPWWKRRGMWGKEQLPVSTVHTGGDTEVPHDLEPVEWTVLVTDTSGSMEGHDYNPTRLDAAKSAAHLFLDGKRGLDPRDKVGLVSFSGQGTLLTNCGSDREKTGLAVDGMRPQASTNISGGLAEALTDLQQAPREVTKRIILLSDGGHNEGPSPEGLVPSLIKYGVIVDTVFIGSEGDSGTLSLMEKLAKDTGGTFVHLKDAEQLVRHYKVLTEKKSPPVSTGFDTPVIHVRAGGA